MWLARTVAGSMFADGLTGNMVFLVEDELKSAKLRALTRKTMAEERDIDSSAYRTDSPFSP
jgi:hypothetical protein